MLSLTIHKHESTRISGRPNSNKRTRYKYLEPHYTHSEILEWKKMYKSTHTAPNCNFNLQPIPIRCIVAVDMLLSRRWHKEKGNHKKRTKPPPPGTQAQYLYIGKSSLRNRFKPEEKEKPEVNTTHASRTSALRPSH
jgi:hypothetical protein